MPRNSELSPTERIAAIAILLDRGERLTTRDISDRFDITMTGAWLLLSRLSRVPELALTFCDGKWMSIRHAEIDGDQG